MKSKIGSAAGRAGSCRARSAFTGLLEWIRTGNAIVGQQISVPAATIVAGRIAMIFGQESSAGNGLTRIFPSPEILAEADLIRAGLTAVRAETIRALARSVCLGQIRFEGIIDSEIFLKDLCEIPGIGKWIAQYVAMRALGEPEPWCR